MKPQNRAIRLFALFTALALFAAACVGTATGSEDAEIVKVELPSWPDDPWDDDYNHFLVQLAAEDGSFPATQGAGADGIDTPKMLVDQASPDDFAPIDPDHPLAGNGETPESPETTVATTTPDDSVDDRTFENNPNIYSATELGGGVWAVATDLAEVEVAALDGVEGVWVDEALVLYGDGPDRDLQWYLDNQGQTINGSQGTPDADINAPDVWGTATGLGIVVAIVDTGMQLDHPDLRNQLWVNSDEICGNGVDDDRNGYVDDCNGANVLTRDGNVADQHGHGTHIAGTIAAETDNGIGIAGIAPDAKLMAVKTGNGSSTMSAGIAGIRYAVDNGAQIMNLSWGTQPGTSIDAVPPLSDALEYARQNGVLVVIAAGNSSANIDQRPVLPASYGHDNIMTIGASTNTDGMAYFSNYGSTSVDMFSPGLQIRSTLPGGQYGWMSGTSMAAPTVAAAAALVWSANPQYSYADVKQALMVGSASRPAFEGKSVVPGRTDVLASVGKGNQAISFDFTGFDGLVPGESQNVVLGVTVTSTQAAAALNSVGGSNTDVGLDSFDKKNRDDRNGDDDDDKRDEDKREKRDKDRKEKRDKDKKDRRDKKDKRDRNERDDDDDKDSDEVDEDDSDEADDEDTDEDDSDEADDDLAGEAGDAASTTTVPVAGTAPAVTTAAPAPTPSTAPSTNPGTPAPGVDLSLRATLIREVDGELWGVASHTLLMGDDSTAVTTDEYAEIMLSQDLAAPGQELSVALDLQLPEGRYALLIETVDGSEATGVAGLISFDVGDPAPATTTTVPGNGGSPTPGTPTTQNPTQPGTPTTQPPAQPGTPTTQPGSGGGTGGGNGGDGGGSAPPVTNTTQAGAGGGNGGSNGGGGGSSPSPTSTTAASGGGSAPTPTQPGTPTTQPNGATTTTAPSSGGGGSTPTPTTAPPANGVPGATTTTAASSGMNIQSVSPNWGYPAGGDPVSIVGSGFAANARVLFGGRPASVIYQQGDAYLLVSVPGNSAGVVDVKVVNPDGQETIRTSGFTYLNNGQSPGTTTTQPSNGGGTSPTPTTSPTPGGGGGGGTSPTPTTSPTPGGGGSPTPTTQPSQPGTPATPWPPYTIDSPDGLTLVPLHPDRKASKLTARMMGAAGCSGGACEGMKV